MKIFIESKKEDLALQLKTVFAYEGHTKKPSKYVEVKDKGIQMMTEKKERKDKDKSHARTRGISKEEITTAGTEAICKDLYFKYQAK